MQNLIEHAKTIALGAAGMGASEIVPKLADVQPTDISTAAQLLTQIAIAIATIIGLFKKKKKEVKNG